MYAEASEPSRCQQSAQTSEEGFGSFAHSSARAGGLTWLLGLRAKPYEEVVEALTELSGVGPKVAACVALFACDKHAAIPVDTHVWKLACKHYLPSVKAKTLSPKLHPLIMQVSAPPPPALL